MEKPLRHRRCLRTYALSGLLLVAGAAVSCKTSDDAHATAMQMTETAKQLSDYYDAMSQIIDNDMRLERLQKATLGVPFDQQDMEQLKTTHEALERRAEMAESLAKLAAALTSLNGSSAPSDVSSAATSLGTELSEIPKLPGASNAASALPPAGKILTQFAQERDERKAAKAIEPTITALAGMFTQERPTYESLNRTYIGLAKSIALDLVNHNQVDPGSLMEPALKPFGLASRLPEAKVPDGLADYAREEIQHQGDANIAEQHKATDTMEAALKETQKHVHELADSGRISAQALPFTFSDVQSWTKKTR